MADWIQPEHSRQHVRRSGDILRNSKAPFNETDAINVLNNWKAAHELPLHYIMKTVKKYVKHVSRGNTIVQRRKRTESILLKLNQQPKLDLARMQDLVGFRVVFRHQDNKKNLDCIEELVQKISSSKMRSKVTRWTNYIEVSRNSGYRSVHAIFKYKSPIYPSHNNMQVELQIRTKIQHIWATAVETVGMFHKSNLKQEQGDENWLEFFRLMSELMAIDEGTLQVEPEQEFILRNKLSELSREIEAESKLKMISIQHQMLQNAYTSLRKRTKFKSGYMLLKLDLQPLSHSEKPTIELMAFDATADKLATKKYGEMEKEANENPMCYVLLAKSEDIRNLRLGFPNYFADIREFMDLHQKYILDTESE
jgi:ppGpp synthetase/RelA/SpoT-type nucleotidyltranferase